ncbi:MAG TPA: hypothetical protein PLP29_03020 [Candidatus Ozemobacteraceae bacterium]|nr:hypothetical protein [Candidatus Ozemobacteraceae bacterium]
MTQPVRRLVAATLLLALLAVSVASRGQQSPSPEAPFTAWLMNNEARTMGILANDRLALERLSQPFGLLGTASLPPAPAERDLWSIHLQYYRFLPEAVEIARLARRFGSGVFARVFDQALPGTWVTMPMMGVPAFNARELAYPLNNLFREALLASIGVDKNRDADLSERLKRGQQDINADHRRLLSQHLETFLALYPNARQVRALDGFLRNGMKKSTAQGVASALGLNTGSASDTVFEFENATEPDAAPKPADTDPGTMPADLFDILK